MTAAIWTIVKLWFASSAFLCLAHCIVMGRHNARVRAGRRAMAAAGDEMEAEYAERREAMRLRLCADLAREEAAATDFDAELRALTGGAS